MKTPERILSDKLGLFRLGKMGLDTKYQIVQAMEEHGRELLVDFVADLLEVTEPHQRPPLKAILSQLQKKRE